MNLFISSLHRKLFLMFLIFLPFFFLLINYIHDTDAASDSTLTTTDKCGHILRNINLFSEDTSAQIHWGTTCPTTPQKTNHKCSDDSTMTQAEKSCDLTTFPQVECPKDCNPILTEPLKITPECDTLTRTRGERKENGAKHECTIQCKIRCVPKITIP